MNFYKWRAGRIGKFLFWLHQDADVLNFGAWLEVALWARSYQPSLQWGGFTAWLFFSVQGKHVALIGNASPCCQYKLQTFREYWKMSISELKQDTWWVCHPQLSFVLLYQGLPPPSLSIRTGLVWASVPELMQFTALRNKVCRDHGPMTLTVRL